MPNVEAFECPVPRHPQSQPAGLEDEAFLLAAPPHDVGKAIDPADHTWAGLAALEGAVSERKRWLIERHMDALAYKSRELPKHVRIALDGSEHFEDLLEPRDRDDADLAYLRTLDGLV